MSVLRGCVGVLVFLGLAVLISRDRRAIDWTLVGAGIGLQVVFALLVLKTGVGQSLFRALGSLFSSLIGFTYEGSKFIFGPLGDPESDRSVTFAFQVLPTIVFFASLMAVLYYLRLVQPLIRGMGRVLKGTMDVSSAEALATAANVFVGQTEAPLVVKPYVEKMTRSELMLVMTGGMATIAGSVLAAYVNLLGGGGAGSDSLFASHLLTASIMSAPAAIVMAKIIVPETGEPATSGLGPGSGGKMASIQDEPESTNVIEAAADGASEGLRLALNVGAMLLAFIALLALLNALLGWAGRPVVGGSALYDLNGWIAEVSGGRFESLSLEAVFGYLFAPLAWALGVPGQDVLLVGTLMGEKVAVNEFVAFTSLADLRSELSRRSVLISTYALCGFANFASIAVQIGGLGGIAPSRRSDIAELALRAVAGGALASWTTASIAGALLG